MKRFLSICLCFVIILSCGALICGCSKKQNAENEESNVSYMSEENASPFGDEYYNIIGTGKTSFYFECIDPKDSVQRFKINTSLTYVLGALREMGMITSGYGQPITTIIGVEADETNGCTWVLYEDDKAVKGNYEEVVITKGKRYSFVAEYK